MEMGKTYIDTVKYIVCADLEINGLVEKPDVVGAVFGQTEGLLGDELDLRELQKNGRIGRIEVDLNAREGKTKGKIRIPSSLDMVETCIIAAALETVDRVGHCEAHLNVEKVEDTRSAKRKVLVNRAKYLLKSLLTHEIPESREISEMVRDEVKTAEITEYGPDRLPAGPMLQRHNDIILVEGRADVINLLKNDIANAVANQGAKVQPSIVRLSKEKEITVFLDGDRGGDIILNELVQGGMEIDFVARAPAGKEVEELTRKELIKCLRSRVPFEQGTNGKEKGGRMRERRHEPYREVQDKPETAPVVTRTDSPATAMYDILSEDADTQPLRQVVHPASTESDTPPRPMDLPALLDELTELSNSLRARFYNSSFQKVREVQVRDVIKALDESKDVTAIVFDGIITQRLVDLAASKGVKKIVGVKKGNVNKTPEGVEIYTKSR